MLEVEVLPEWPVSVFGRDVIEMRRFFAELREADLPKDMFASLTKASKVGIETMSLHYDPPGLIQASARYQPVTRA